MKEKKKTAAIIGVVILCLCAAGLCLYLIRFSHYQKAVSSLITSEPDIETIPDGIYSGECDVDFIYARVLVTVKDGAITQIDLTEHKNGRGEPAETILDEMIKRQSLRIDAVAGATNSGKVIQKAVEQALQQAGTIPAS